MIDKRVSSLTDAVADIKDGSTDLVSGFGGAGSPIDLLHALLDQGAKDLIVVCILIKIEEAIQDVEGIKEIISTARRGSGTGRRSAGR